MRAVLVTAYALAALAAVGPATASARRWRQSPFAAPIAVTLAGVCQWSAAQAMATAMSSLTAARILNYAIFPGVCTVVIGFLFQAVVMTRHQSRLSRRAVRLLAIHPALLAVAILTDPAVHLFYTSTELGPSGLLTIHPGPLYWAHTAYSYAVLAYSTALIFRALLGAVGGHRRTYALYLIGALAPAAGNLITLTRDLDRQSADLTPIMFLVTAVLWWLADRGFSLTRIVPIAYQQVVAALTDAVIVIDPFGAVLTTNPAAARLYRERHRDARPADLVGQPWHEVLDAAFAEAFGPGPPPGRRTVWLATGGVFDARIVELRADRDRGLGWVMVARDVTEVERLRADLANQASHDPLTDLHNRRHLTDRLPELIERARAGAEPLALTMIDIDNFKQVNDTFGHTAGDMVLVRLAGLLARDVRQNDTVARYGGEEFVVVMPGATAIEAGRRVERWRLACAAVETPTDHGPVRVTFSAGIAELDPADTAQHLVQRADGALYEAKRNGRNRVVSATAHPNRRAEAAAPGEAPSGDSAPDDAGSDAAGPYAGADVAGMAGGAGAAGGALLDDGSGFVA